MIQVLHAQTASDIDGQALVQIAINRFERWTTKPSTVDRLAEMCYFVEHVVYMGRSNMKSSFLSPAHWGDKQAGGTGDYHERTGPVEGIP